MLLANAGSRILGLARDALLASKGGLSLDVDAYNIAFLIPDLINHFLAAGLLPVTLIPLLSASLKSGNMEDVNQRVSRLLNLMGILTLTICGIAFWKMDLLVATLSHQPLSPELLERTVEFGRILIFAQVFFVLGGFFNAVQYGSFKYGLPALAPIAYNGAIILGGLLSPGNSIEGFCWGVVCGALVGGFAFQAYGAFKLGFRWMPLADWKHPEVRTFLWATIPFLFGASAVFSAEFAYRFFGSGQTGDVSALGFGLRIALTFAGVLGGAVGVAVYPQFSRDCAENLQNKVSEALGRLGIKMGVILIPPVIWMMICAPFVVQLYLGWGAFDAYAIAIVAENLRYYLLLVMPMTALLLVNRAFYANRQTWLPSLVTLGVFALSWPFYGWLEPMGLKRIPILAAVTTSIQVCVLGFLWTRRFKGFDWHAWSLSLLRVFISVVIIAIPAWWIVDLGLSSVESRLTLALVLTVHALAMLLLIWFAMAILGEKVAREWMVQLRRRIPLKPRA